MIYGHLSAPDAYAHLLVNPAWKLAFDWLKTVTSSTPAGIQKLQGEDIYVNVHGYDTLSREQCRFESHRRYVDLQYCISGSEIIDWSLASALEPDGAYDGDKDLQFYHPPHPAPSLAGLRSASDVLTSSSCLLNSRLTPLSMFSGSFAIFHPSDAHRPKVRGGVSPSVFKLVIKVDRRLDGPV
jgi:YhcH/YjgK/YiaL family protein